MAIYGNPRLINEGRMSRIRDLKGEGLNKPKPVTTPGTTRMLNT